MCADRTFPFIKHKLVLLGDQSVGKTSIINRFMYDYFDDAQYQATIGIDFFSKNITVERPATGTAADAGQHLGSSSAKGSAGSYSYVVKLHIWDTAGQERYRSLIPSYVRNSAAAVVVYDVGNRESFLSAFTWVDEIKHALGMPSSTSTSSSPPGDGHGNATAADNGIVIMLVGNKLDLGADGAREVSTEEAERRAQENNFLFCEVSAKNGTNIKHLFRSVAHALPAAPYANGDAALSTSGGGGAVAGGGGAGQGKFGAATRDPFLITPSVMAEADRQQQGGGGANGAAAGGGGGCC